MAQELAHTHEHVEASNTGVDNRKLGFWLFLSSESVFFACLLVAYIIYHEQIGSGPGQEIFNVPLTSVSTFVLLMSSLAMVLGVHAAEKGMAQTARRWVAVTALMGLGFLGFQAYEFMEFYHHGLTLYSSLFGTTFFVLTGFHGAHVAVGVIWLLSLLYYGRGGGLGKEKAGDVEVAGLYWHFVDVVWIVLFTVIYLIENVQ